MIKNSILLLSVLLIQFAVCAQSIDKEKSVVDFKVPNMGGLNKVSGTFTGFTGSVKFDPTQLEGSKINVCIDASTINTGNKKRDDHLKSEDFFEVEKYAKICFSSNSISKHAEGFVAKGKLQIHGVEKTVEIPLIYNNNQLTGLLTLDRFDYNIGEDTGTFMVGKEVKVVIKCVLK